MSQFLILNVEQINSSADINDHISQVCDIQVENVIENSSQPQLKYMMSSNSSKNEDEPIQNVSEKKNQMKSTELKLNESVQNDMQIQSYKHINNMVYDIDQNNQKRHLRTRRKLNFNTSIMNYQYENNSSSQNQTNIICKCTKSNCLKLYCLCFHQNQKCSDQCKCVECKNRTEHFEIRLNALEKVKQKLHRQKNDEDLFDRSQIWGCKCQKSQCQKNYCECFLRNQKCSSKCRCKDCANKKRFPFQQKKKQKN